MSPVAWSVLKQFVLTRIVPPLVASATTWIVVHAHFLALFHITGSEVAKAITYGVVWAVTFAFAWASTHFSLKGHYLPGKQGADE